MHESVKSRDKQEGNGRKHSCAIKVEEMKALYNWSQSICPVDPDDPTDIPQATTYEHQNEITKHLMFSTYTILAFTLWTR